MPLRTRVFVAFLILLAFSASAAVVDGRLCSGKPNFASGGVKGIDFDLGLGATKLSFDLHMDGVRVEPEWVRLGFRGTRPPEMPFRVENLGK